MGMQTINNNNVNNAVLALADAKGKTIARVSVEAGISSSACVVSMAPLAESLIDKAISLSTPYKQN